MHPAKLLIAAVALAVLGVKPGAAQQNLGAQGAERLLIPGLGHDMPRPSFPKLVEAISAHTHKAAVSRGRR